MGLKENEVIIKVRFEKEKIKLLIDNAEYYGFKVADYCRMIVLKYLKDKDGNEKFLP
jgi:hypothetical protein